MRRYATIETSHPGPFVALLSLVGAGTPIVAVSQKCVCMRRFKRRNTRECAPLSADSAPIAAPFFATQGRPRPPLPALSATLARPGVTCGATPRPAAASRHSPPGPAQEQTATMITTPIATHSEATATAPHATA